jgi:hypothetical protein
MLGEFVVEGFQRCRMENVDAVTAPIPPRDAGMRCTARGGFVDALESE